MAARTKDYYQVLGVTPRSHARVIEESYWERAHELHGLPTRKAQQRLGVLNEAYEVLGTPHKRAAYDRKRHERDSESNGHGGSSFFTSVLNLLGKPFRPD
jgi:DnaJ-class molecular chaperone